MSNTALDETMKQIETEINGNPEPIKGMDLVYQFEIDGGVYQLHLKDGAAKVKADAAAAPNCTLIMSYENFNKFLAGKLNGMTAFMTGKLKIQGDMTKALKLEGIVKEYQMEI
ncbi:SCP2 sterol-binding domain-containing protein [Planococcus sp. CAU13]|uniref:SCP2 sterol-binding domain-containing protein n=1 Tax=Planococcus sp. CAU13 TaxID=1541197 RepID=UPI00052FFC20|nr:SCP2 sterol-binding domain-containing protein [Planococcus sp. CAU13]